MHGKISTRDSRVEVNGIKESRWWRPEPLTHGNFNREVKPKLRKIFGIVCWRLAGLFHKYIYFYLASLFYYRLCTSLILTTPFSSISAVRRKLPFHDSSIFHKFEVCSMDVGEHLMAGFFPSLFLFFFLFCVCVGVGGGV